MLIYVASVMAHLYIYGFFHGPWPCAIKEAMHIQVGHQRSHIYKHEQPYPEQKHWQIQPATYVGQSSVFHPRTKNQ